MFTFLFAIGSLALIRIPMPPKTQEGSAGQESFLKQATYGWTYILKRPGLLALLLFFTFHNLMIGIVMVLPTPMILSFASVDVLGNVLAARRGRHVAWQSLHERLGWPQVANFRHLGRLVPARPLPDHGGMAPLGDLVRRRL